MIHRAFITALCALSACVFQASALDITIPGDRTYRDCTGVRAEGEKLVFIHATGTARLSYIDLPDELRMKWFTPAQRKVILSALAARADAVTAERLRKESAARLALEHEKEKTAEAARRAAILPPAKVTVKINSPAPALPPPQPAKVLNEKITTRDGEEFLKVTAKDAVGNSLRITHAGGVTVVAAARLPEEIQKAHFFPQQVEASVRDTGFSEVPIHLAAMSELTQKAIAADAALEQRYAEAMKADTVRSFKITMDSLTATGQMAHGTNGTPLHVVRDLGLTQGQSWYGYFEKAGTYEYTKPNGERTRVENWIAKNRANSEAKVTREMLKVPNLMPQMRKILDDSVAREQRAMDTAK